jgi:hypothetical protein
MSTTVRVVAVAEERLAAWIVAVGMGLATGAIVIGLVAPDEWLAYPSSWHRDKFWFGAACASWSLGLLLTWTPRPRVGSARVVDGVLELRRGRRVLATLRGDEIDLAVAPAARGYSVAIGRRARPRTLFLEVERETEARALVAGLGATWPGPGGVVLTRRFQLLRLARQLVAFAGMVSATLYAIVVGAITNPNYKATFGLPAIACAFVASVIFLVEPLARREHRVGVDTVPGDSALARHLRVHRRRAGEDEAGSAWPAEGADEGRARTLARAVTEERKAWLARVDALAEKGAEGYRGDAFSAEELRQFAEDASASADARLGALRLLARVGGAAAADEIRARVARDLGAERVRAVLEEREAGSAADKLHADGPIFRAGRG